MKLSDVRQAFRLIGEIREQGADPNRWRPHMIGRLLALLDAELVISSEIHVRPGRLASRGAMRIHDIGWGTDGSEQVWQIHDERDGKPEEFGLSAIGAAAANAGANSETTAPLPIKPLAPLRGGTYFILSQVPLPHLGAVDQLGIHRAFDGHAFTADDHKLVRLFHTELGRLWKKDALARAKDPAVELPPRLAQTLAALQRGCSEKQVSLELSISKHTVHNYVKALHARLGVSSRGELLAKAPRPDAFTPKLSFDSQGK